MPDEANLVDDFSESLLKLDQKSVFNDAFKYIKNKTNKNKVTLGDLIYYLLKEKEKENESEKNIKFKLGFTAIVMFKHLKEEGKFGSLSESESKLIIQKIAEDMC